MAVVLKQSPVQYVDNDSPVAGSLGHLSTVEWVGLDVETMGTRPGTERYTPGLDPHLSRIRLLTLATPDTAYVFDLAHVNTDGVFRWLHDHKSHLIIHNARFDLSHLQQAGVFLPNAWDTFLADRILRVGEHGSSSLAAMAERYLGETMEKELQVSDWSKELTEDQIEYAGRDALVLPRLRLALLDKLSRADIKKIAQIEFGAVPAFAMLARTGFYFDSESWTKLAVQAEKDLADITEELHQVLPGEECPPTLFGMEPKPVLLSSPAQVKAALNRIGVKVDGTSEHELLMVDHPVVSLMLRHRQVMTRLKMFLRPMPTMIHPVTGRIHAEYWQTAAASGRTASSNPNIQQIPHDNAYRSCFTAGPGRSLVIADYSQIELRIVAEECGDPKMLEAFEKGLDIHQQTAALVTGKKPEDVTKAERQNAKACFSGDTEILTKGGWVRFDRYDGVTPIAQYHLPPGLMFNPPNGKGNRWGHATGKTNWDGTAGTIEFVKPEGFQRFSNQQVYRQTDRNTDLLITGNHEVIFVDTNGRPRKMPAIDIADGNCKYLIAGGTYTHKPKLSDPLTRVLAMVVADGSFAGQTIRFGFSKSRKIERCREILQAAGVNWSETKRRRVVSIVVHNSNLVRTLLRYTTRNKILSWCCLDEINGRLYLEEASFWDSHRLYGEHTNRERVLFSTIREETADVMQAIAAISSVPSVKYTLTNVNPLHSTNYRLSYRLGNPPRWRSSWHLEDNQTIQDVWCVQVPSAAILVRRNGKVSVMGNCNFGLAYGMGADGLVAYARDAYGVVMSRSEAAQFRRRYFEAYPKISEWHHRQVAIAKREKCVRTLSGRIRPMPEPLLTVSANSPTQGTGADILKLALGEIARVAFPRGWDIVAEVHDEIVLEVPEGDEAAAKAKLEQVMISAGQEVLKTIPVEAEASVGKTWADK